MQNYVQQALRDSLVGISGLVTWLGGTQYFFAEGDVTPEDVPLPDQAPYCVFEFRGMRNDPRMRNGFIQTWAVLLFNKDKGYYDIEYWLGQIYLALNEQTLNINSVSPVYCLNTGVRFVSMTNRGYDQQFHTQYEGIVFDVHLGLRSAD